MSVSKLSLFEPSDRAHHGMVHAVCWNPLSDELLSIGDDKIWLSWRRNYDSSLHQAQYTSKAALTLKHHCVCTAWCPDQSFLAAAFSDGALRIISCDKTSFSLQIDKNIENAHHGAIICLSWNHDGTALVTGGEDGVIKQWSRSGNLRSKLCQSVHSIHALSWTPNSQCVVFASDKYVNVQAVQGKNKKTKKWKAHNGIVLCLDWNVMNNVLITGGEDCYFRIWDEFGRLLHCSKLFNYPITSLSWAPNGQCFSVGSYNLALFCDAQGWIYEHLHLEHGSVVCMAWTADSTQLGLACAHGNLVFGHIANRSKLHGAYFVQLAQHNQMLVQNISRSDFQSVYDTVEFTDTVTDFSVDAEHLIATTRKQCYIYQLQSMNTPQIVSLKLATVVYAILQTCAFFVLINNVQGIQIIGYDGRTICQIKSASVKAKRLHARNVSCAIDTVAVVDVVTPKLIHFFDPFTAQSLCSKLEHCTNIAHIALNMCASSTIRMVAFIDNNKDLFITRVHHAQSICKLKTIVDSMTWHPDYDILFALCDKQLLIWFYPSIVWCDTDLQSYTVTTIDASHIGSDAHIVCVENTLVTIRTKHGDEEIIRFSPLPLSLYDAVREGHWNQALRLCHLCDDEALWGTLTGLAIDYGQIEIALQGLSALEEADKILFLRKVQNLPLQCHKDAELELYRKNVKNAENILLQNDLVFRAIELNLRLLKWRRALEIAVEHQTHINMVRAFRVQYLKKTKQAESIELFLKPNNGDHNEADINWNAIQEECEQEIEKEFQMARQQQTPIVARAKDALFLEFGSNHRANRNARKELQNLLRMTKVVS